MKFKWKIMTKIIAFEKRYREIVIFHHCCYLDSKRNQLQATHPSSGN